MSYRIIYCTRLNFVPLVNTRQEDQFVLNNETIKKKQGEKNAALILNCDT